MTGGRVTGAPGPSASAASSASPISPRVVEHPEPSWKNLLPELLLALLGCSGGAFVYEPLDGSVEPATLQEPSSYKALNDRRLVLSDLVDWVSAAEREQLNRIVQLGWYYERLNGYAMELTSVRSVTHGKGPLQMSGLMRHSPYQVAIAQGCLELLDVYRQAILKIEARLVDAGVEVNKALWSLLPLEQALSEFFELFSFLCERIDFIESEGLSGREILRVFETAARSGIPVVEGCSLRIVWHCYQVLFKQMHAWMVHGRLVDPTGEFFIHVEGGHAGRPQRAPARLQYIDGDVVESRLPGTITLPFAKDVLYVGQCTRILNSLNSLPRAEVDQRNNDGPDTSSTVFEEGLKKVWLSSPECVDWIALRNLVSARKVVLSDKVWTEVHHADRNLAGHVDDFVGLVLQDRGSLYTELVQSVSSVASDDPDPDRAGALAAHLFREAAYCDGVGNEDNSLSMESGYTGGPSKTFVTMDWYDTRERFGTSLNSIVPIWHPNYDNSIWIPSYDAWDGLCIRYDMKWPMHLVFPLKAMRVYGALWQLMFRMTRALHDMKRIRVLLTRGGMAGTSKHQTRDKKTMALHHRLYHFLSTYAMYLQEEIVARSKEKIHGIFTSSTTLIEAEAKHMEFIVDIVQTSCIDIKQVMGVVENMFACVKSLESIVCNHPDDAHTPAENIESICERFLSKYNVWYQLLQSNHLQAGKRGEATRRLLLKMNFNGFMDSNAARQVDQHVIHLTDE